MGLSSGTAHTCDPQPRLFMAGDQSKSVPELSPHALLQADTQPNITGPRLSPSPTAAMSLTSTLTMVKVLIHSRGF